MAATHPNTPRRLALIKPSALGDIANSLPVLTALRRRFPETHITWIVNREYESLLRHHPDLDDTLVFERFAGRRGLFSALHCYAGLAQELWRRDFDTVIDLQGLLRTGLMTLATGARRRIGFACAREGAGWCYTETIPVPLGLHAVDRYLLAVEALGGSRGGVSYRLAVEAEALTWAYSQLKGLPRPWLAVGVGARWATKRWPVEHFAALVRQAQAEFGGTAIFIGGADAVELQASRLPHDVQMYDLTGRTTLVQLAAVLSLSDVLIANDTGPLHLAVALGRPVVAPYTCTQVRLHGPYGQLEHAVETSVPCRASYLRTCARMACMTDLVPAKLWPILQCILETWRQNSPSISRAARLPAAPCSNEPATDSRSALPTSTNPAAPA